MVWLGSISASKHYAPNKKLCFSRNDLHDAPLLTKRLRDAREQACMPKYKSCVIRVSFPDEAESGWYLQSRFKPEQTARAVFDRVRPLLENPEMPFVLCELRVSHT